MIRTKIVPKDRNLVLPIPESYVGKEVEVLLYTNDDLANEPASAPKKMSYFSGLLSDSDYQSLKASAQNARDSWTRDI